MRTLKCADRALFPKGVKVIIKGKVVTITGPRGTLIKDFKNTHLDLKLLNKQRCIKVELWFGNRKDRAKLRTILSHLENMITGVTKGYQYKMRLVYAHFPINTAFEDNGKKIVIRNFLGERVIREIKMLEGVTVEKCSEIKDQFIIKGNDINLVSQSAANIHQSTKVKNKDIRKFLDGIYVSEKSTITN